ncbi:MAG: bifunctional hydroxymethylpyrimidine kinase/phosphomethylpyrimidine kinase, partial [Kordiimonas sp.]
LLDLGPKAVLLKGGHLTTDKLVDILLTQDGEEMQIKSTRLDTRHTHGTGCTLASALATGLARGESLELAFSHAHTFVHNAIVKAPGFGKGNGPLGHAVVYRGEETE